MYEGKTTEPSKVRKNGLCQKLHIPRTRTFRVQSRPQNRVYEVRKTTDARTHPLPERHTHIRTLPLPFSSSLSLSSRLFLSVSLSTCGPVDMVYEFSDPDKDALTQTMWKSSGQVNRLRWMIKAPQLQVGQGVASQQPDQGSVRQNEVCAPHHAQLAYTAAQNNEAFREDTRPARCGRSPAGRRRSTRNICHTSQSCQACSPASFGS